MNWVKAKGKLVYEPERPGIKKESRNTPWWIIVEFKGGQMSDYYSWWMKKLYGVPLQKPVWGNHVTILDGRKEVDPKYRHVWKKYNGQIIDFEYNVALEQHWKFISLPVRCEFFDVIRKELGFFNSHPYHMTVGRVEIDV